MIESLKNFQTLLVGLDRHNFILGHARLVCEQVDLLTKLTEQLRSAEPFVKYCHSNVIDRVSRSSLKFLKTQKKTSSMHLFKLLLRKFIKTILTL